jgi:hypothetical protein
MESTYSTTDPLTPVMLKTAVAIYRRREHLASRTTTLGPAELDARRDAMERLISEIYYAADLDVPVLEWADTRRRACIMLDTYPTGAPSLRAALAGLIEDELLSNRLLNAASQVWRHVHAQDTGMPENQIPGLLGCLYTQDVTCRSWYLVAADAAMETLGVEPDMYEVLHAVADAVASGLWWVPGTAAALICADPDMTSI